MKESRGITLVALIITIVVLLILAGITIANLTGGDGVLEQASSQKNETTIANEKQIISNAVIAASNEDKYGEINESNLQEALKDNITDITGITENGPWKVTSSKTGINYLIRQNYEVIQFPENTGTITEMGVKSGDYVNYTAGNWTQEDIDKLGNLYSGENIPDSTNPYTFGGFKVGQSKDIGIIQGENNTSIQDNEHAGWRVLSFNDDGSVNIIHAGAPEWYYHPISYKNSWSKSAYRSLYIFGGGKTEEVTEDAYEGIFERTWKMYENLEFCNFNTSHMSTREELKFGYTGPNGSANWVRKIGITFWVNEIYPSGGGVFACQADNGSMNNYGRNKTFGIRPVVTLKAECLYQNINDESTTTHNTQETAWNLVI